MLELALFLDCKIFVSLPCACGGAATQMAGNSEPRSAIGPRENDLCFGTLEVGVILFFIEFNGSMYETRKHSCSAAFGRI